ncbi:hypothetical protein HDU91_000765 [Kappamyces sp. JEL0680]|nr:hypothetical protein HDU91_000765 [Kappamyces sp. JEL0680]
MHKTETETVPDRRYLRLFKTLFVASSVVGAGCATVFIVVLATNAIRLFSAAYWGLLAAVWVPGIYVKWTRARLEPELVRDYLVPSVWFACLAALCGTISTVSLLAARANDKIAALFAGFATFEALAFGYLSSVKPSERVRDSGVLSKIRSGGLWLLSALLLVVFGMATFQSIGLAAEAAQFGYFDGQEIMLNDLGYKLHLYCAGTKQKPTDPLIWFEHGLGGSHLDWSWIQRNVSEYGRACSYDHGGLGWSEIPSYPRTTEQIVRELTSLLAAANITDDLLIVGHSMAGYNARVAERLLPNRVVGLVLADPVDTEWDTCEEGVPEAAAVAYTLSYHLNTFGVVRMLKNTPLFPQVINQLPDRNGPAYFSNLFLNHNLFTRVSESTWFGSSCGYAKRIVSTTPSRFYGNATGETLGSLPYGLILAQKGDGIDSQAMARLSNNSVVLNATDSSHVSLLHVQQESLLVSGVVRAIWNKIVAI